MEMDDWALYEARKAMIYICRDAHGITRITESEEHLAQLFRLFKKEGETAGIKWATEQLKDGATP